MRAVTDTQKPYSDDVELPSDGGPQLEINRQVDDAHRCVVTVRGELDIATADQLAAVLAVQLADGHVTVCLDLAGLAFCDAAGLNALLDARRAYESANRTLAITRHSSQLAKVLRLTGLDGVLITQTDSAEPPPSP